VKIVFESFERLSKEIDKIINKLNEAGVASKIEKDYETLRDAENHIKQKNPSNHSLISDLCEKLRSFKKIVKEHCCQGFTITMEGTEKEIRNKMLAVVLSRLAVLAEKFFRIKKFKLASLNLFTFFLNELTVK